MLVSSLGRWGQILLLLIMASWLGSCRSGVGSAGANPSAPSIPVTLQAIQPRMVDNGEEFVASLVSRQSVELKPRVEGQVAQISSRAGDTIRQGTTILQIDAREQAASVTSKASTIDSAAADAARAQANVQRARASVSQAQASLANATATLETLKADRAGHVSELQLAQRQYARYQSLLAEGAVSQQVVDEYQNTLAAAQANLNSLDSRIAAQQSTILAQRSDIAAQQATVNAEQAGLARADRQIQQAQADTQQASARLQYYNITAPFDGTIGDIPVKEGDFVDKNSILATLTQNDALEVNLQVPIEKLQKLAIGTLVEVLNNQGHKMATSRVFFISPKADPATQSILVKAKLDNSRRDLRADQFIKARVIWQRSPSLTIPTTAISRLAGQNFVYVAEAKEDKLVARQKPVKLGVIQGNNQQVTEGLKAGDKVITSGVQKLSDGAPIVNSETLMKPQI